MLASLIGGIFGTKNERELKRMRKIVEQINALEPTISALSDADLSAKTPEFKQRYNNGESLDKLLPEAFAVCREAAKRVMGMRHYDVQLIGGITLHEGKIAEMRTGEGKTLMGTLACYLNALSGEGVHVITVNDYLAQRDAELNRPLFEFLGLSIGTIYSMQGPSDCPSALVPKLSCIRPQDAKIGQATCENRTMLLPAPCCTDLKITPSILGLQWVARYSAMTCVVR